MERMVIPIHQDVEKHIRGLVPVELNERDMMWFADWLLQLGLGTVKAAMEKHPELTLSDLIQLSFFKH